MTGIADARQSRVADDRDVFARHQFLDQLRRAAGFVVFMIADQRFVNLKVPQKVPGMPSILAGDEIVLLQRLYRAQSDVAEIPDRRGDEEQHSRKGFGDLRRGGGAVLDHVSKPYQPSLTWLTYWTAMSSAASGTACRSSWFTSADPSLEPVTKKLVVPLMAR